MFERFTERARRVLFFARYEASQYGSTTIDPEHILLGVMREGKGLSGRLFARSHISLDAVRGEIESRAVSRGTISASVEIPFSAAAKRALECAVETTRRAAIRPGLPRLGRVRREVRADCRVAWGVDESAVRLDSLHDTVAPLRFHARTAAGRRPQRHPATSEGCDSEGSERGRHRR